MDPVIIALQMFLTATPIQKNISSRKGKDSIINEYVKNQGDIINEYVQNHSEYYNVTLLTHNDQNINRNFFEAFNNLQTLKDNWDGYGAISPTEIVIKNVKSLLSALPNQFIANLTEDNIYPNPNGTITIEWANEEDENIVSIEVGEEYSTFYSKIENKPLYTNNNIQIMRGTLPSDLIKALNQL